MAAEIVEALHVGPDESVIVKVRGWSDQEVHGLLDALRAIGLEKRVLVISGDDVDLEMTAVTKEA